MTQIPVLLDCVVVGVLTPIFGVSSVFVSQMDAGNGLSVKIRLELNFGFWERFGSPEKDLGARKSSPVHRDHGAEPEGLLCY